MGSETLYFFRKDFDKERIEETVVCFEYFSINVTHNLYGELLIISFKSFSEMVERNKSLLMLTESLYA